MIRIATTLNGLENAAPGDVDVRHVSGSGRLFKLICASLSADFAVVYFDPRLVFPVALFLWALPFVRCRLVVVDLFLPAGPLPPWKARLYNFLLARVHLFLVFVRDTRRYRQFFRFRDDQLKYVPYKVNASELIAAASTADEPYIFSGGKSRRDFSTLIESVKSLDVAVRIVTAKPEELRMHGSSLPVDVPPNVEICTHDNTIEFFIQQMARARLVVLPITADVITQAGIAVYLMAMALGKCVIVSAGPGVDDVLENGEAIIVPPGDAAALAEAIQRAWSDPVYRNSVAERGKEHARRLGGTERLLRSIVAELTALHMTGRTLQAQRGAL